MTKPIYHFKKGSNATDFEFVGIRDQATFGELFFVAMCESSARDFLSENLRAHWYGCARYALIGPGEKRPIDVVTTDDTIWCGSQHVDLDEFADNWVTRYDLRTQSEADLIRMYGQDLPRIRVEYAEVEPARAVAIA